MNFLFRKNTKKQKVTLPFQLKDRPSTFLHLACYICSAYAYPQFKDHKHGTFINLSWYPDWNAKQSTNPFPLKYDGSIHEQTQFNNIVQTNHFFDKDRNLSVKKVIDIISSGYYCGVMLDEFFIPQRPSYQTNHFCHDNYIYGYNRDEQIFYSLGFIKKGVISLSTFSFKEFKIAQKAAETRFYMKWKVNTEYKIPDVLECAVNELECFLNSRTCFKYHYGNIPVFYGIEALRYFNESLDLNLNHIINEYLLAFYTLRDQCRLIVDKLDYFNIKEVFESEYVDSKAKLKIIDKQYSSIILQMGNCIWNKKMLSYNQILDIESKSKDAFKIIKEVFPKVFDILKTELVKFIAPK